MDASVHSITSKAMFSPSRSQSSHRTSTSAPFASRSRCFTTPTFVGFRTVVAPKSSAGLVASQFWYLAWKSRLKTCPTTEVTRCEQRTYPACPPLGTAAT